MKCPNCNVEVSDDATFCPKCGAKLDGTEMPKENNASSENGNSFHLSKKIITIAVIVIAIIILALSCPNKQTHVEALNNAIMTYLTESMSKDSTMTKDGSDEFATGLASSIVPKVLNSKLNVNNYFLFSLGEFTDEGKTKTVSFGILGHVFPIGLSDSEKELDEAINGKHK
jgi:hypothetical protein